MIWVSAKASLTAAFSDSGFRMSDFDIFIRSVTDETTASLWMHDSQQSEIRSCRIKDSAEGSQLTFMYNIPQLNSFPAPAFLFASFSPFTVVFSASPPPTRIVPFRSTAPRMCRSRPWNVFLSRDSYAERAEDEETKVMYAVPFGPLVSLSMGMWTYMRKNRR